MWGDLPPGARRLPVPERDAAPTHSFDLVFADSDPFGAPFTERVEGRAILFPVRYRFDAEQFSALVTAAGAMGEHTAYCRSTEAATDEIVELPLDYAVYKGVRDTTPTDENCLCSTHGTWGLLFSHEDHVVVGGVPAFVDRLLDGFPPIHDAPVSFDVTSEMEPWSPEGAADATDMVAHYESQGARRTPPLIGVSAREQGAAFVAEVRRWRHDNGATIDWLPGLLAHIYGENDAQLMLDRAGLR
jgi:hypothetical protein